MSQFEVHRFSALPLHHPHNRLLSGKTQQVEVTELR